MTDFAGLGTYSEEGHLQMVVESPRGALVKLRYEPKTQIFTASRALALGIAYPFDWGFIPGTKAEDGDPVDALALYDGATYPGVVLPCKPIGLIDLVQKGKSGIEQNPRLLVMPVWHERWGKIKDASDLPDRLKEEIERFFLNATFFTGKDPEITGWRGARAAAALVESSRKS
jgi:inorganic pyrophosphatase